MKIQPAISYSHQVLKTCVQDGDIVIDGTVGNGNDTEFLARIVGVKGKVYGFDVQEQAIQHTKARLANNQLNQQVKLFKAGHENIAQLIHQKIQAAIFNLGYLPGGDHQLITHGQTTIQAIQGCLSLLNDNGIIVLVLYYGHPGGQAEKDAVLKFSQDLDQKRYTVLQYQFINQINNPPMLLAIQKR